MRKLRFSRRLALLATAGTVVLAASAAGVGLGTSSGAPPPFKIMFISGFGGTFSNANPEILTGAQAAANTINKQGGLGGRQIALTGCSHLSTVAGDVACTRTAIAQSYDDIIWRSSFAANSIPLADAAGIPHIGMIDTLTNDYLDHKLGFPVVTTSQALFIAGMAQAMSTNKAVKKWAGVGVINSGSNLTVKQVGIMAKKYGDTYIGGFENQVLDTNFLPTAQKLAAAGVQGVVCSCPVGSHIALNKAFQQLGYTGVQIYVSNTDTLTPAVVQQLPAPYPKIIGGGYLPPSTSTSLVLTKQFLSDLTAANQNIPLNQDAASEEGWIDMWAIAKLAKTVKGGSVTSASMVAAAKAATAKHPINLFGTLSWTPGAPGPAAVPNASNGLAWAATYSSAQKAYVLANPKPYNAWKILGIAR
jgi:ABC-type branched-subunit amino acid transport system substrate-binding protein